MTTIRAGVMAVGVVLAAFVPAAPAWGADAERDYWQRWPPSAPPE
jgi:hypothetical protein